MRYGICIGGDYDKIGFVGETGFDYVESCFEPLATGTEENYKKLCGNLDAAGIACESVNCFVPGRLKVTGPDVDYAALKEYVENGMKRGPGIGLKTVVFGSAGARNIPDGFPFDEAMRQMIKFLREIVSPAAEKNGITVVIEPLKKADNNVITTVREGAMLCAATGCENVKLLGDSYHMCQDGDNFENLKLLKGLVYHSHTAEGVRRACPRPGDGTDYKSFIENMEYAGCTRCSIECRATDFYAEAPVALELLRSL